MSNGKIRRENKIRIFTVVLIILVVSTIILNYYSKTLDRKDRLTAKRIEQAISMVVAKYASTSLVYSNGRIFWNEENSLIIKSGITEMLTEDVFPTPSEKGYYYYMYLESPYTVIKLPYYIEGKSEIDLSLVTGEYMKNNYPKKEYVQVDEKVPNVLKNYDNNRITPNNIPNAVVCLNS